MRPHHQKINNYVASEIAFTGIRAQNHYSVGVGGKSIALTYGSLKALMELVLARSSPGSGFARFDKMTIARLRAVLVCALGDGAGKVLIETGSGEEYRLAIPRKQLRARVLVSDCFFELIEINVVRKDEADALRRVCGKLTVELAEQLLDGD
jgi:hypothetical protein